MPLFFLIVGAILTALKIAGFVTLSWMAIAAITFIPLLAFLVICALLLGGAGITLGLVKLITARR